MKTAYNAQNAGSRKALASAIMEMVNSCGSGQFSVNARKSCSKHPYQWATAVFILLFLAMRSILSVLTPFACSVLYNTADIKLDPGKDQARL